VTRRLAPTESNTVESPCGYSSEYRQSGDGDSMQLIVGSISVLLAGSLGLIVLADGREYIQTAWFQNY
jgi:hypothetical protein